MDYSQLSDFEINKRVFKAIVGAKPLGYPHNADGRSVGNEANGSYRWYDYCNNPADAWPIITENNISIILDNPSMPCATDNARDLFDDAGPNVGVAYDNPLRAAMIVFLMMQDANNA
ncbi:phage protein NinX family protein [Salmonella enterica subsp. enterica serovar Anatum]